MQCNQAGSCSPASLAVSSISQICVRSLASWVVEFRTPSQGGYLHSALFSSEFFGVYKHGLRVAHFVDPKNSGD